MTARQRWAQFSIRWLMVIVSGVSLVCALLFRGNAAAVMCLLAIGVVLTEFGLETRTIWMAGVGAALLAGGVVCGGSCIEW